MRVIRETLQHTRGDKRLAAKLLGIATRTIYRRLESLAASERPRSDVGDDADEADES
jgi:two-component system response regulator HydG